MGGQQTPSGSIKDNEEANEVTTVTEVEVVESRDRNHGRAVTENAVGVTPASTTCDSTKTLATRRTLYDRGWGNSIAC